VDKTTRNRHSVRCCVAGAGESHDDMRTKIMTLRKSIEVVVYSMVVSASAS